MGCCSNLSERYNKQRNQRCASAATARPQAPEDDVKAAPEDDVRKIGIPWIHMSSTG
jgi:hypothetical protein